MASKKTKYRRGFIADCQWYANAYRQDLEIPQNAPLCPWKLCKLLCVQIIPLSRLPNKSEFSYFLEGEGLRKFSAVVCFENTVAFILLNDRQSPKRQASSLAHEIGHIALGHRAVGPIGEDGKRQFEKEYEDEAERFGPEILVSDQAALLAYHHIYLDKTETLESLSDKWGLSKEVLKMRMQLSGASRRLKVRR